MPAKEMSAWRMTRAFVDELDRDRVTALAAYLAFYTRLAVFLALIAASQPAPSFLAVAM